MVPPLQSPEKLLLVSKRSTADPMPEDTPEARLAGWKKMCLLVGHASFRICESVPEVSGFGFSFTSLESECKVRTLYLCV